MVELVVTMLVMGILAATAMPRFFGVSAFQEMGFTDSVAASIRSAQKLAMHSGCDTRVSLNSSSIALWQRATDCDSGGFTRAVLRPGGGNWTDAVPQGVGVGALDIYFDAQGRPHRSVDGVLLSGAQDLAIGSRTLRIEPLTGLVHRL